MNCYECKYRDVANAGTVHSKCMHPGMGDLATDHLLRLFSIFASVQRELPIIFSPKVLDAMEKLGITVSAQGVENGWMNWPFDFDPVWILTCEGWTSHE